MQYHVCFNGQLVERTRPDGWPHVVKDQFIYECEEANKLADYLNTKAKEIQVRGGMHVNFDKNVLLDIRSKDDLKSDQRFGFGYFIPLHMIAAVFYTVRPLVGALPMMDDDGSGVVKQ